MRVDEIWWSDLNESRTVIPNQNTLSYQVVSSAKCELCLTIPLVVEREQIPRGTACFDRTWFVRHHWTR